VRVVVFWCSGHVHGVSVDVWWCACSASMLVTCTCMLCVRAWVVERVSVRGR
jgi:hypothetical protein